MSEKTITPWHNGRAQDPKTDTLSDEEPLQMIINGHSVAVLMRTPGDDRELVIGFLFTEGIVANLAHIESIDLETRDNHALVFLIDGVNLDLDRLTRHLFSASSCGLCGKASIEAILQNHPPLQTPIAFTPEALLAAPEKLRRAQRQFERSGGIHASGLFNANGDLLILREDIGRHNALDKVIGSLLEQGGNPAETFLLLSGRISFELMQKALAARISLVAGISAPSSLAVEFAETSKQTLLGFLRPPTFNLYAGSLKHLEKE